MARRVREYFDPEWDARTLKEHAAIIANEKRFKSAQEQLEKEAKQVADAQQFNFQFNSIVGR